MSVGSMQDFILLSQGSCGELRCNLGNDIGSHFQKRACLDQRLSGVEEGCEGNDVECRRKIYWDVETE
jgi:hypothetical protein